MLTRHDEEKHDRSSQLLNIVLAVIYILVILLFTSLILFL
jgi:hypothetical protein